jgi:signal peptidase I
MRSETRTDSWLFSELLRSLVKDGIEVRFRAEGRSMYPALRDGDVVQIEAMSDPAEPGDVLMVESATGLRVHRVVQRGEQILTQGDCCFRDDGAVGVLGKVQVASGDSSRPVPAQRLGSLVRRWLAPWRGRF